MEKNQHKRLVLCSCEGSQPLDPAVLETATGLSCSKVYSALCTTQIESAAQELAADDAVICCTQEWRTFYELAQELEKEEPILLDLRDRAGWTKPDQNVAPKMAALIADSMVESPPVSAMDIVSEGTCLIRGHAEAAFEMAQYLKETLAVTILVESPTDVPLAREIDVICGRVTNAKGSLGAFELEIDRFQQLLPSDRGPWRWSEAQGTAHSQCDIFIDLAQGPAAFPAPEKRDGYFHTDPKSKSAFLDTVLKSKELIGTFEKDLFIRIEPSLCAHSRAEKVGCSNCIDICPTAAITPAGDYASVDPAICAGCGACSMLCPSGAITYDAASSDVNLRRMHAMIQAYWAAGGENPRLLVHDDHGREMIALLARFGTGLPADVIPLELGALATFGHSETLAAHALGFAEVFLLLAPRADKAALEAEAEIANAIWPDAIHFVDTQDPDAMGEVLWASTPRPSIASPARPMGTRRQVTRVAAKALVKDTQSIALPAHAPYGAVLVDQSACTLCLSCVSLCPSGALGENPDQPELRFQEDACLQCGLCSRICPEQAITYEPRLNLDNSALEQQILKKEDPFACIECGALFGVKSTIERITEKLAGNHAMFTNADAAKLIKMCDNCRVNAQFHAQNSPFAAAPRPQPRTTDDYLTKRKGH